MNSYNGGLSDEATERRTPLIIKHQFDERMFCQSYRIASSDMVNAKDLYDDDITNGKYTKRIDDVDSNTRYGLGKTHYYNANLYKKHPSITLKYLRECYSSEIEIEIISSKEIIENAANRITTITGVDEGTRTIDPDTWKTTTGELTVSYTEKTDTQVYRREYFLFDSNASNYNPTKVEIKTDQGQDYWTADAEYTPTDSSYYFYMPRMESIIWGPKNNRISDKPDSGSQDIGLSNGNLYVLGCNGKGDNVALSLQKVDNIGTESDKYAELMLEALANSGTLLYEYTDGIKGQKLTKCDLVATTISFPCGTSGHGTAANDFVFFLGLDNYFYYSSLGCNIPKSASVVCFSMPKDTNSYAFTTTVQTWAKKTDDGEWEKAGEYERTGYLQSTEYIYNLSISTGEATDKGNGAPEIIPMAVRYSNDTEKNDVSITNPYYYINSSTPTGDKWGHTWSFYSSGTEHHYKVDSEESKECTWYKSKVYAVVDENGSITSINIKSN